MLSHIVQEGNFFYEWENFYFTKHVCIFLFLGFISFSFRLLNTANPNNVFCSEANRRQHISLQDTGYFLSLIRQQLQLRYYTDANRTRHFTKTTELLNQNDGYSNVLEGRVRHQTSLGGIFGAGIIIKNECRRVLQYSCTLHKKSCFLLRKNFLRKNVSHVWEMRNGHKILVGKSERNKHLRDLAGTLQ